MLTAEREISAFLHILRTYDEVVLRWGKYSLPEGVQKYRIKKGLKSYLQSATLLIALLNRIPGSEMIRRASQEKGPMKRASRYILITAAIMMVCSFGPLVVFRSLFIYLPRPFGLPLERFIVLIISILFMAGMVFEWMAKRQGK